MSDNDWEKALALAEEMMGDSDYDFAIETIEGIHDWIVENEAVTERQFESLKNIYGSCK